MDRLSRRAFLAASTLALAGCARFSRRSRDSGASMRTGLVTYQWGRDWDIPTLIANLQAAGMEGVELRTTHKHGVEPGLSAAERREVKARFADSPITLVGLGSVVGLDSPDPDRLAREMETAREFFMLSRDVGGSGVKLRPNNLHERRGIPRERTLEQIGRSLGQLAAFARELGQEARMEVHGDCAPLPLMRQIMLHADHPNAKICWNSNRGTDLAGAGLAHNFELVRPWLGRTVHVHDVDNPNYPSRQLAELLGQAKYRGWILWEESRSVEDAVAELARQRRLWQSWT